MVFCVGTKIDRARPIIKCFLCRAEYFFPSSSAHATLNARVGRVERALVVSHILMRSAPRKIELRLVIGLVESDSR